MSAPSLPSLLVSGWEPTWSVAVPAAASGVLYVWAVRRAGRAGRRRRGWPVGRTISWLVGLGCIVLALQSGIDRYDDQMLSVHMVQHMLLLLIAPLLLLGGRPLILALRVLPASSRGRVASALSRIRPYTGPVPALCVFTAVIVLTHLAAFYDAAVRHPALHDLEHALYVGAGLLLFSPLLDGDPAPAHRLSGLGRLAYVIAAMVPMALIGAYLNRHASLAYPVYGSPGRALGIDAVDDQAQAGAIMWVAGNTIMVLVGLWAAIGAMLAEERRQQARDARGPAAVPGGGGR
jgi:cytochrome c oxidase assembly factor CtaG